MQVIEAKFSIPKPTENILLRPQLFAKLTEGLTCKLTMITAPSGYGKTMMTSNWALEKGLPLAWLTLDKEDNTWVRFCHHFIEAIKKTTDIFNEIDLKRFVLSENELLSELLTGFSELTEPLVIVLDDFHTIQDELILQWFSFLINHLPLHVHIYVISHACPRLRVAKLRTNGEVNEVDMDDLRLDKQELEVFCKDVLSVSLSKEEAAMVLDKTEGWITGIKLFILIMQENERKGNHLTEISGAQQKISTYFFEEVFENESEKLQQFLMKTSILCFLNLPICEAVTGLGQKEQLLQEIESKNLFIVPLEDNRKKYRYHRLFHQFLYGQLRAQLSGDEIANLHLKAGKALEAYCYYEEAINHFIFGEDFEKTLQLLEKTVPRFLAEEKISLWKWTNQIPGEYLITKPKLYLLNLFSLILEGKMQEATEQHLLAEHYLREKELSETGKKKIQNGLFYLMAFRGYLEKDLETAVTYSKKYLENNPEGEVTIGFGMEQSRYHPIRRVFISSSDLRKAEQLLQPLLEIWATTKSIYFYAHLCIDYGKLLYEWNRLEEAEEYLLKAIKIGRKLGNLSLEIMATLLFVKVQFAANREEKVDYLLDNITTLVKQEGRLKLVHKIDFFRLQIKWKQGKVRLKSTHPLILSLQDKEVYPKVMIDASTFKVSLLIEEGKLEEAEQLLQYLLWICRVEEQQGNHIKLLLYRSLLLERQGNMIQSYYTLEEALDLSQKDQYIRTFLDLGEPLANLLSKYLSSRRQQVLNGTKQLSIDYVEFLLQLFPVGNHLKKKKGLESKTILTDREIDVLKLMSKGLSNKDIAFYLDLSISTVKTHTNNIYRKLQVNSRLQAVQRASRLGILNV